jgi:hypothetical protein
MGFYFALVPFKGWAGAEVDGGGFIGAVGKAGSTRVDSIGGQAFVFGSEIGGRKPESVTATFSRDDLAEDGKGATEHGGGID